MLSVWRGGDIFLSLPSPYGNPSSVPHSWIEYKTSTERQTSSRGQSMTPSRHSLLSPLSFRYSSLQHEKDSLQRQRPELLYLTSRRAWGRGFHWGCVGSLGYADVMNPSTCLYYTYSSVWCLLKFMDFHAALLRSHSHSLCLGKGHTQLLFLHITICCRTHIMSFLQTVVSS